MLLQDSHALAFWSHSPQYMPVDQLLEIHIVLQIYYFNNSTTSSDYYPGGFTGGDS